MIEKISNLLGEGLSKQVAEKLGEVELGIVNDGTLVPAEKHDSMKAEKKAVEDQLQKLQDDIKQFEGSESTIEELKAQLNAKAEEFESFKTEASEREIARTKVGALAKALEEAGAVKSSIDLLVPTFDLKAIQLDKKGNIVDLDDTINPVKEARKELFAQTVPNDNPPPKGKDVDDEDMDDQAYFNKRMKKE